LQLTGPAAAAVPAAEAAPDFVPVLAVVLAADFVLSMPPCPWHAPRPPCSAVVPSLQVTGPTLTSEVAAKAGVADIAPSNTAAPITSLRLREFMEPSLQDERTIAKTPRIAQSPRCR
jgi:hypothetical protein